MISLQRLINSSLSLRLVSLLAQTLPPRAGYPLAEFVADQIARQRTSRLLQAVRANQWVVHGERLEEAELDRTIRATLRHSARCLFDLYHYIRNPDAAGQHIVLEPSFQPILQRPEFDRQGLLVVGLHLSNFDLILQWLCQRGLKLLVITIPDPQGGRRLEYEMRRRTDIELLPASEGALRQALKYLHRGGMVLTGADRPIPNPEICPLFFGRPAALPLHHIFLATRARVPLMIAVTRFQPDGKYHAYASDPIEMDAHPDPDVALLRNAENVLRVAEGFIRQAPWQWSVPLPVWPQILDLVPS
jgi:KDO2-lipid IV(A) lauroyltransferase